MIICDTPDKIAAYRLLALKAMLSLECKGLKGRTNAYVTIKNEFKLKGNKKNVLEQYINILKEKGILQ